MIIIKKYLLMFVCFKSGFLTKYSKTGFGISPIHSVSKK